MADKARIPVTIIGDDGMDECTLPEQGSGKDAHTTHQTGAAGLRCFNVPGGVRFTAECLKAACGFEPEKFEAYTGSPRSKIELKNFSTNGHSAWRITARSNLLDDTATGAERPILRITGGVEPPEEDFNEPDQTAGQTTGAEAKPTSGLVVIVDSHGGLRSMKAHDTCALREALDNAVSNQTGIRIIVNLDEKPPLWAPPADASRDGRGTFVSATPERENVWNILAENKYSEYACVVCSARKLRHADAGISRHLSWERTIETLGAELRLFPELQGLAQFKHLIVRFGCVGAAHIWREGGKSHAGQLIFAPNARDGVHRDRLHDGDAVGYKSLIVAALLNGIVSNEIKNDATPHQAIGEALRTAMLASVRLFDGGFEIESGANKDIVFNTVTKLQGLLKNGHPMNQGHCIGNATRKGEAREAAPNRPSSVAPIKGHEVFGIAPIPASILAEPSSPLAHFGSSYMDSSGWDILRESLNGMGTRNRASSPPHDPSAESLTFQINVAMAIALYGHRQVLNTPRGWVSEVKNVIERAELEPNYRGHHDCKTLEAGNWPDVPVLSAIGRPRRIEAGDLHVPIIEFGKLKLIEREEMESLRSVRNLVREYAQHNAESERSNRPLSIAVFGPPGSGKSFAVKQIVHSIAASMKSATRTLHTIDFNVSQFRSIADLAQAATEISNVNHQVATPVAFFDEFDSAFAGEPLGWLRYFLAPMQDGYMRSEKEIRIGPAVFIFCGGVFERFEQFVPAEYYGLGNDKQTLTAYTVDEFRRRKGPDFVSRLSAHVNVLPIDRPPGSYKQVVRRALLIRDMLEARKITRKENRLPTAMIDEDVLYALLTIDRYRHGVRSMEAVLSMCVPIDGRIEKASLPAFDQLNMHVDAREFAIRMYRGRVRRMAGRSAEQAACRDDATVTRVLLDGNEGGPTSPLAVVIKTKADPLSLAPNPQQ